METKDLIGKPYISILGTFEIVGWAPGAAYECDENILFILKKGDKPGNEKMIKESTALKQILHWKNEKD